MVNRIQETNKLNVERGSIARFGFTIDKAIIVVLLSAIGYFLGWRFLFTYYGSFGLDQSILNFSPTEIAAAGWRSFVMMLVLSITGGFIHYLFQKFGISYFMERSEKRFYQSFWLFLSISVFLLFISGYYLYYWGTYMTKGFFILSGALLCNLWITYIIGNGINSVKGSNGSKHLLFNIVFPNSWVWLGVFILGLLMFMNWVSAYNGALYARRDKGVNSTLQIATFFMTQELNLTGGELSSNGVWKYDDLRFLYKTDTHYFLLRLEEVNNNVSVLYAIPDKYVLNYQLRSWWHRASEQYLQSTEFPTDVP